MKQCLFIILLCIFCSCGGDGSTDTLPIPTPTPIPQNPEAPIYQEIQIKNSIGRSGFYYLPAGYNLKPLPVLIAFHGTNYSGKYMVDLFRQQADRYNFIILAPDSNHSRPEWQDYLNSNDTHHTNNCIQELIGKDKVQIDSTKILTAGWSGGGWFASYYATNNSICTSYAVLHGGVTLDNIGPNIIPGFFSSGEDDGICSPPYVKWFENELKRKGYPTIFQVFPGDHFIHEQERETLINWWLNNVS